MKASVLALLAPPLTKVKPDFKQAPPSAFAWANSDAKAAHEAKAATGGKLLGGKIGA